MDLYGRVRHAVLIDGMSRREAARIFGINRRTVEKMLTFSIPPGYRRDKEIRRPKLGGFNQPRRNAGHSRQGKSQNTNPCRCHHLRFEKPR